MSTGVRTFFFFLKLAAVWLKWVIACWELMSPMAKEIKKDLLDILLHTNSSVL